MEKYEDIMDIQWYPGHMAKTIRMLRENLGLVDIVVELLDARIPYSSKNPVIDELAANKRRIVVLNKADLAEPAVTSRWESFFLAKGFKVCAVNAQSGQGLKRIAGFADELTAEKRSKLTARGRIFTPVRAMIVGIPNVGKSTLINSSVGQAAAKTGDTPGVTRGRQWIRIRKGFELLDTPGILWPRFDDPDVGLRLAFTGAIVDRILDTYTISIRLIQTLLRVKPQALSTRYGVEIPADAPVDETTAERTLEEICRRRGFLMKSAVPDLERAAMILLDEFRGGKLGPISLETVEDCFNNSPDG